MNTHSFKKEMPRPLCPRKNLFRPRCALWKPQGIPARQLEKVHLAADELTALRFRFLLLLEQQEAAEKMGVSQPTFSRLLASASQKLALALASDEPRALAIEAESSPTKNIPGGCRRRRG